MKRNLHGDGWVMLLGDALARLADIPSGLVHACMTSPPFWSLRDYGVDGQLGGEPTPVEFVSNLVSVFREVRRVLRNDGVAILEIGDTYRADGSQWCIPERLKLALMDDGWCVRQTVIWARKSPMPESLSGWRWAKCRVKVKRQVRDPATKMGGNDGVTRPSLPHPGNVVRTESAKWSPCPGCEKCNQNGGYILRKGKWRHTAAVTYIFVLTKGQDYFADGAAAGEKQTPGTLKRFGKNPAISNRNNKGVHAAPEECRSHAAFQTPSGIVGSRNPRNFLLLASEAMDWSICKACKAIYTARDYRRLPKTDRKPVCECGATDWLTHYAAYPPTLCHTILRPFISKGGCCQVCGTQFTPVVVTTPLRRKRKHEYTKRAGEAGTGNSCANTVAGVANETIGYKPACTCGHPPATRQVVLDPFSGSGSTGLAANHLGATYLGIELNEDYALLAQARLNAGWKPREKRKPARANRRPAATQQSLF